MSWDPDRPDTTGGPVGIAAGWIGAQSVDQNGTVSSSADEAEQACHDVLLAMAGRLPDRLLWRLRDWLSSGAHVALRTALPRALLRHRIGVSEDERARLRTAVLAWGGPARLVDAVLHVDAAPEPTARLRRAGPRSRDGTTPTWCCAPSRPWPAASPRSAAPGATGRARRCAW